MARRDYLPWKVGKPVPKKLQVEHEQRLRDDLIRMGCDAFFYLPPDITNKGVIVEMVTRDFQRSSGITRFEGNRMLGLRLSGKRPTGSRPPTTDTSPRRRTIGCARNSRYLHLNRTDSRSTTTRTTARGGYSRSKGQF